MSSNSYREVKLPSGAVLKVQPAPFAQSKTLYQAILSEMRDVTLSTKLEFSTILKDLFCVGFSSPLIDAALKPCMERCLYNGMKIAEDTFEPVTARDDYMVVCSEVAKENVFPFVKSLYAEFQRYLTMAEKLRP